jgi:hypothetical protein
MSHRHDPRDPADSVVSTGGAQAPSWIEQAEGLRFPLAFIYGLSAAGAIGLLTPLPAVIAVVLAAQAVRRRVPHAGVALGVALIATAIGTWLMFSNPFMSSQGDGL